MTLASQISAGVCINRAWQIGLGPALEIRNPITAEAIVTLNSGDASQLDAAVKSANLALPLWSSISAPQRGAYLAKIAELVEASRAELVGLQCLNNGKPASEADLDVSDVVATFAYYATLCQVPAAFEAQTVPLSTGGFGAHLTKVPVGVVGLIMPWNFPMVTTAWKLAPALAAGCTAVLKPSELTPLVEIALFKIILAAGLPSGVVNLVWGDGAVGAALCSHPLITKISFTGSNATGQRVISACAPRLAKFSLELGGKSSLIVLEDADLGQAVDLAIGGAFFNAGQMCSATAKILVARPLMSRFNDAMVAAAAALKIGDPHDGATTLGPIISQRQFTTVQGRIAQGLDDGAKLLCGGKCLNEFGGYHIAPTIFTGAQASPTLWEHEVFGPVACIASFDTPDQAVDLANDSSFGLVATIVSGDHDAGMALANRLHVGTAWVNAPQVIFPETGWGGFKQSGVGRELGPLGLSAFQEVRHIVFAQP